MELRADMHKVEYYELPWQIMLVVLMIINDGYEWNSENNVRI